MLSEPLPSALVLPNTTLALVLIVVLPVRLFAPDSTRFLLSMPIPVRVRLALPVIAPAMVALAKVLLFLRVALPVSAMLRLADSTRSDDCPKNRKVVPPARVRFTVGVAGTAPRLRSSLMTKVPPDRVVPPVKLLVPDSTNSLFPVLMSRPPPVLRLPARVMMELAHAPLIVRS